MRRFNDDIMRTILARVPALSFAAAACINKTWRTNAVKEVLDKVLSKPIRPHFAITDRLKARVPLVVHMSHGDGQGCALSDELREVYLRNYVKWEYFHYSANHPRECNVYGNMNQGIVLVLGFVPGLKDPDVDKTDNFSTDIKDFTAAASGRESPSAIMMFGVKCCVVPQQLPQSTYPDALMLLEFHVILTGNLMPFGPPFEVIVVGMNPSRERSVFPARMEGCQVILSSDTLSETLLETVSNPHFELYIGAAQRRG
ncbi:F-box/LRR-repeat protein At5g63520-like [Prosopis cineraria]|uniref:F-box/LRR-repeat protein At5g63520-like n=1 Tax=Prosopis cineraria TaxID=364024 RepID=UPI0024104297|nr:F-box/LRR-repeat protein At5g63520-like [Prosopis cineraria]